MPPTASDFARRLREIGVHVQAAGIAVEHRGDRAMVRLPGERIAWFAASAEAAAGLEIENRVLTLLGARCSFRVPGVLYTGPDA